MDHSIHCVEGLNKANNNVQNNQELSETISELRKKFLDTYAQSPDEYDSIDVENIKTNDFQIKRFLTYNNLNANQAFDQLIEAMKWKKSFGVKRDFSELGVEIFHCGGLFIYEKDRESRPVFYARVKTHMRIPVLDEIVQDVIVATLERLDQISGEKGYTVVMDASGAGISNIDMKVCKFMITVMQKYYPETLKCLVVVNMPFVIKTVLPIIRLLLGSKYSSLLHVANQQQLFEYIHPDNLPKYLGGNSTYDFTQPPKECTKKAVEFNDKYDISPKTMRKAMKKFEPIMAEAKSLVQMP